VQWVNVMKGLLVDDSRTARILIGGWLKELGLTVVEGSNGREALDRLEEEPDISVAFVDWNMPVMDGLAFVRAVRANPAHANLRLLMVTVETGIESVSEALDAGADEYLMKPFDKDAIRQKLELLGLL
jgi:two-component system chemotaxis response regulator CheY